MTIAVVHIPITKKLATLFIEHAPKGKLNRQTIHNDGEGNLCGFIAEQYMLDILHHLHPKDEIRYDAEQSYDYDILFNTTKLDVKTKMRTSPGLRPDWDVSIASYTIDKQLCDAYAFCSVTFSKDKKTPLHFYYAGMMGKEEYLKRARVLKKGQLDGDNILPNGQPFRVRKDCMNMRMDQLYQYSPERLQILSQHGYSLSAW